MKNKTIFVKTFIPVLVILLLVIGSFMLFIHKYILQNLYENILVVYEEQMINRKSDMENLMLKGRNAVNNGAYQVTNEIQRLVENKGLELSDIKHNVDLNQEILISITDKIIETLRTSGATDIFLILDGYGSYENKDVRAGIYIRNSEPESYVSNNSSLLYERGIPDISKGWKLPLDIYWQSGFLFDEEEVNDYFFKPLQAAEESGSQDIRSFGYWSYGNIVHEKDFGILTYSVPLAGADGTLIGVLGIGINENFLMKYYNFNELDSNESRIYVLAKTTDGNNYNPYLAKGKSYGKTNILPPNIVLPVESDNGVYFIDNLFNTDACVNLQEFQLYNYNTPFKNERWALIGVQSDIELFSKYYMVQRILNIMLIISTVICTLCVFWFSRFISVPIQHMVSTLRKSDPNRPIILNKTHIDEIDELAEAVENLSIRVVEGYSKISTIIQMSGLGIAVFEYKEKENLVFCSNGFFEMIGYESITEPNTYIDATIFNQDVQALFKQGKTRENNIMSISLPHGKKRWFRVVYKHSEKALLGLMTDITTDVIEKKKIENERDYDVLTNLLNRRAFEKKLDQLKLRPRDIKIGAMLVWDLDNLKFINDTFGHNAGDDYLIAFADCLIKYNSDNIISARRSGDEFLTFIYGYDKIEEIEELIEEIWNAVKDAYIVLHDQSKYEIRISMGIAWYPKDAIDFNTLFYYADFALYVAKNNNKGKMQSFDRAYYQKNRILTQGQEAFYELLKNRSVEYMMQPIVWAEDGSIYGYEMLMRSKLDLFKNPTDILSFAYSSSKLHDIEIITWFEAMKAFVAKINKGICSKNSKVFINSIANQIMNEEDIELFSKTFYEYLTSIVCEVTEKELNNKFIAKQKRDIIKKWGGMLAIDRYKYSNKSTINLILPDIIKIDMDLVRGIDRDEENRKTISNLADYTKERNILLLAQGIETKTELKTLVSLGVDLLQGYYIAEPSFEGKTLSQELLSSC